jgi:hypothetical protein
VAIYTDLFSELVPSPDKRKQLGELYVVINRAA